MVSGRARGLFLRFYEWPLVGAAAAFMLWVRLLPYSNFLGGERAYFIGTDPYYHLRVVLATVANFPFTLRFDPFTRYPLGTGTGQFGSLFDILVAGVALLVGGGAPDRHTIALTLGVFPAVLGALLAIPFYFLARRFVGRVGAVFALLALALLPGEFLVRALAGYADHHVAEALGMVLALLGGIVAVETAASHNARLADLRDWRKVKRPIAACVLGALAVVLYFGFWPPAVLIVGIFAVFFAIQYFVDHARGVDTGYLAFSGALTFSLAGVLLLPFVDSPQLNFNTFSYLQPLSCLLTAAGVLALEGGARALRARRLHPGLLPAGSAAAVVGGVFALKGLLPSVYASLTWGASWVTGVGVQRTLLTIAEAHESDMGTFLRAFGLLIYVLFLALAFTISRYAWKRRRADLLFFIWGVLMLRAAYTQVRFTYYLAPVAAVGFGYLAHAAAEYTGLNRALHRFFHDEDAGHAEASDGGSGRGGKRKKSRSARGRRTQPEAAFGWHQFVALAFVGLLLLPVNVMGTDDGQPGWKLRGMGPDRNLQIWVDGLHWLRENTPGVGVDLEAVYTAPPKGGTFQYAPGTYGVLSWWDYGHWIQVEGERPPVANPFQQNAPLASHYFTNTSEEKALRLLGNYTARNPTSGPIRYVMIDDQMAAGKFPAITVWADWRHNFGQERHKRAFDVPDHGSIDLFTAGAEYDRTMLARLYFDDGSGLHHYRLVHEHPTFSLIGNVVRVTETGYSFPRFHDVLSQFDYNPNDQFVRDQVLRFEGNAYAYDLRQASSLKTLEYVEGARLAGNATAGETVWALLRLKTNVDREFIYRVSAVADENGRFEIVVPYSTSGEVPVEEGGTRLAVKSVGGYAVVEGDPETSSRFVEEFDVPEEAVRSGGVLHVEWASADG